MYNGYTTPIGEPKDAQEISGMYTNFRIYGKT